MVRVKTDERRNLIKAVATEVFREKGYERASMSAISKRLGGSKSTLYSYFESKEELFVAAMFDAVNEQGETVMDLLDPSLPDMSAVLRRFGEAYLEFISGPDTLSVTRAAVAEGAHVEIGTRLYEKGPKRGWEGIRDYLVRLCEKGVLRPLDTDIAAGHFKGMLEAGIVEPLLFGAKPELSRKTAAAAAVEAFLRAYGNDAGPDLSK